MIRAYVTLYYKYVNSPVAAPAVPIFAVLESLLPTCFWRCRPCELSDETDAPHTRDSVSSVSASGGPSR
jgi:hypothetical protein